MKLVAISDTHLQHNFCVPNADLLLHAGDLTWIGSHEEMIRAVRWLEKLPAKFKVVIAGNHDKLCEKDNYLARALFKEHGIIYLQDEFTIIEGVKIYGAPYQPEFGHGWAFNLRRGLPLKEKWDLIPEDANIVITHGPVYGYGDIVYEGDDDNGPWGGDFGYIKKHVGCRDLRNRLEQIKPRYHLSGHIHNGYGVYRDKHTTYINGSVCNERYQPIHPPIVIDYETGETNYVPKV